MNHLKMHKIRISKNSWISGIVNPNFRRGYFKRYRIILNKTLYCL